MTVAALPTSRRLSRIAARVGIAMLPTATTAQEVVERGSPDQQAWTVVLAGIRHVLYADQSVQIDAGGGHTNEVSSDVAHVRLTARPAKFASVLENYVYVAIAADPEPRGRLHIARVGGELTHDIGPFRIANQAELELLAPGGQSDIAAAGNSYGVYHL